MQKPQNNVQSPGLAIRKTSLKLIEKAANERWIKQMAFYHILKFRFNNSCIYNYKSRMSEIADQLKISKKTLYNYLNILRSKNMLYDHSENLILISLRKFRIKQKKNSIFMDDYKTLFDITCLLYAKLIEAKAKKQTFMESVRRMERGDSHKGRTCENPFLPFSVSMSYRTIAKLLKVSEFKAFNVIQNLNRLEVIKIQKQSPRLISKDFTALDAIDDLPGYRFNIGGRLFEQYGNRIDFIQFPVFLKRITSRHYKQLIHKRL